MYKYLIDLRLQICIIKIRKYIKKISNPSLFTIDN